MDLRIKIQSNFINDILIKTECGEIRIKRIDMRVSSCSVCQNKYNEDERCPLLVQCRHGICCECLSKMFSASTDCSLSCPTVVSCPPLGILLLLWEKKYAILSSIQSSLSADDDDDNEDEGDDDGDGYVGWDEKTYLTTSNHCYRNNVYGGGGCNSGSR